MNNKQKGSFKVARRMMDNPEEMADIFRIMRFVPWRAEYLGMFDCIEFQGIAEVFSETPDSCIAPEYTLEIDEDENGLPVAVRAVQV